MDYGNEIILACEAGIAELEAIKDYTMKIQSSQNDDMKTLYTNNRAEKLPHIQNIIVALTAMLSGEEPSAAAQMDETEPAAEGDNEPPDGKTGDGEEGGGEDG